MTAEQDFIHIPKEARPQISVRINMAGFSKEFDQLVREHDDMNYSVVLNKTLQLGYYLFSAEDGVNYSLRDSAGFEEPISIMDERFSYDRDAVVEDENGGSIKRPQHLFYRGRSREFNMNRANAYQMDLEEATARQLMAGIYILQRAQDGVSLVKAKDGRREFMNTSYPKPKYQVKDRIYKHFEEEVTKWFTEKPAE